MSKSIKTVLEAIGNTPIVKLVNLTKGENFEIYAKCEFLNPGGAIKDRIARHIVEEALKSGKLKPGGMIIEATSGNTGMGLAICAAHYGLQAIFTLADKMSNEKIDALRAFGAEVIVCPTVDSHDPESYHEVAKRLAAENENAILINQYHNPLNAQAHYDTTGPEILTQTAGEFDVYLTGMSTGGTLCGTAKYLREHMPDLKVVASDPAGSGLANYFKTGQMTGHFPYKLEGVGEDMLSGNIDMSLIDEFITIDDGLAFRTGRELLKQEGLYAGGSSGMNVAAALQYGRQHGGGIKILTILPDSGNRYASKMYCNQWMADNQFLAG